MVKYLRRAAPPKSLIFNNLWKLELIESENPRNKKPPALFGEGLICFGVDSLLEIIFFGNFPIDIADNFSLISNAYLN